jgi:exoribonuclease R
MTRKSPPKHSTGPSQPAVLALVRKAGRTGITAQQMLLKLGLGKRDRDGLHAIIDNLVTKGKVEAGARGRYMALGGHAESGAKAEGGVEATIDIIMSGAGYARLGPGKDDVYVPENAVGTALHGDKVLLRISSGRGRPRARCSKCWNAAAHATWVKWRSRAPTSH